jgi:hypothetical protein
MVPMTDKTIELISIAGRPPRTPLTFVGLANPDDDQNARPLRQNELEAPLLAASQALRAKPPRMLATFSSFAAALTADDPADFERLFVEP